MNKTIFTGVVIVLTIIVSLVALHFDKIPDSLRPPVYVGNGIFKLADKTMVDCDTYAGTDMCCELQFALDHGKIVREY